jgi:hypothetical protein
MQLLEHLHASLHERFGLRTGGGAPGCIGGASSDGGQPASNGTDAG